VNIKQIKSFHLRLYGPKYIQLSKVPSLVIDHIPNILVKLNI
jgi:hypothetical protein